MFHPPAGEGSRPARSHAVSPPGMCPNDRVWRRVFSLTSHRTRCKTGARVLEVKFGYSAPRACFAGDSVHPSELREQRLGSCDARDLSAMCNQNRSDTALRTGCNTDDLITVVVVLLYSTSDWSRVWNDRSMCKQEAARVHVLRNENATRTQ